MDVAIARNLSEADIGDNIGESSQIVAEILNPLQVRADAFHDSGRHAALLAVGGVGRDAPFGIAERIGTDMAVWDALVRCCCRASHTQIRRARSWRLGCAARRLQLRNARTVSLGGMDRATSVRRTLLSTQGYAGAAAAIRDGELQQRFASIKSPTLILTGNHDVSMPFTRHGEVLLASIGDSTSARIDAGHLAPLEAPHALAQAIDRFLMAASEAQRAAQTLYEGGLEKRRHVLGNPWVDRALSNRTSFDAEFQEMITRIAWQEVWGRPALDERTRRLVVVAVTAGLGRWEEFSLHTRSGLMHGGFSRDELKEVLMQLAIYAGVPTANTAFSHAKQIIAELDGSVDVEKQTSG